MTEEHIDPAPGVEAVAAPAVEPARRRKLRLYLGGAPGVGKTYSMLQEAHRLKAHGTDVVVGFVETHGRPRTAELIEGLEVVPPRLIPYKGVELKEMDTQAVIARKPEVALVDELAHTNAPGSEHEKRYQDVMDLLDAGITVISTVNVQHIESLNDYVRQVTGVEVRETVPDWVVDGADQVELIDMAPEALIQRMKHGNIYPPEQARRALENYFTLGNLTVLRDLALRATASEVEQELDAYMHERQGELTAPAEERIMVAVDHRANGKTLIRRGWRMAAALRGELIVVHVDPTEGARQAPDVEAERQLRATLQLADQLGAKVIRLRGKVAEELIACARAQRVTQLVLGHPSHSRWHELTRGSVTKEILRQMPELDVLIIPQGRQPSRP